MPTDGKSTLTGFLAEESRRVPTATGELNALVTDVSLACKAIARRMAFGALRGTPGETGPLDVAGTQPLRRGEYLLMFDSPEGAANIDLDVAAGSIFSIVRAQRPGEDACTQDLLLQGKRQVCAGYAIYGPSTMLVLTLGSGTHAFMLEPARGEWVLGHSHLRIPERTREFAIDASTSRFWGPAVKRYVDECLAGQQGARGADFDMRWIGSLVAQTHRILMRGGVFLHPQDSQNQARPGRLPLLHEANTIAFLVEQAGGRASNGRRRIMELPPEALHQRVGLVFGSSEEVARIERYHHEEPPDSYDSPLFGRRGLFCTVP